MRNILTFDAKNYELKDQVIHRTAIRAIIIEKPYIYLIQSKKYQEYKFPGGGLLQGETHLETLIRETKEEAGIKIKNQIKPYGHIAEKRKSVFESNAIFKMDSYYYLCEILSMGHEQQLDPYEKVYGYELKKVLLDDAIKQNEKLVDSNQNKIPWVKRELYVLKMIKEELF